MTQLIIPPSLQELLSAFVLAVLNFCKNSYPFFNCLGNIVEHHTIDKRCGRGTHASCCRVLPEIAGGLVGVVPVTSCVETHEVLFVEIKFVGDFRSPNVDEFVPCHVSCCLNEFKLGESVVFVLIHVALGGGVNAQVQKVGQNLGNLERVNVVRKRERGKDPGNLVIN